MILNPNGPQTFGANVQGLVEGAKKKIQGKGQGDSVAPHDRCVGILCEPEHKARPT